MKPREQGDWGERIAAAWFLEQGYPVFVPFGHSADVDLVTRIDDRFVGVQVKTSRFRQNGRWGVAVCTRGGNQSWNRIVKRMDPSRCDFLFVVVADGRRWLIPASAIGGGTEVNLGGPKYARYEVAPGPPMPLSDTSKPAV